MSRFFQHGKNRIMSFQKEDNVTKLILREKAHSRSRYSIYADRLVLIVHKNGDLLLPNKVLEELGNPEFVGVGVSDDGNFFGVCAIDNIAGKAGYGWSVPQRGPNANVSRIGCGRIISASNIAKENGVYSWQAYIDTQDDVKFVMANTAQNPSLV